MGTNGIAGQSVASSHGSRDALGQEVAAEPVAGSSGGHWVTKPRPPACYVEQEVSTAERGRSVTTNCVQRVVAAVPQDVKEVASCDDPFGVPSGIDGRLVVVTPTDLTGARGKAVAAAAAVGSARWHQLKELEIAQVTGGVAAAAQEQRGGAAVSGEGAVSVEERAVEEEEVQRKEAAVAVRRIAQEQQLQLEESFASAQRAALVASNAETPEEREAAWAVRKQYVSDQRADRGQVGPIPPAALKQLEVGSAAGEEQAREIGRQYAVPGGCANGRSGHHRQSTAHRGIHLRRSVPVGHSRHQPVRRVASAAQQVAAEVLEWRQQSQQQMRRSICWRVRWIESFSWRIPSGCSTW